MANWNAAIPDFTVKGADKQAAITAAEKKIANHKAGLEVTKVVVVPPPPAKPPFLKDTIVQWSDPCSSGTPVEDGRWSLYPMGRKDGQQASSTKISEIKPGRFTQIPNGPGGKPAYRFATATGDNIWTPGNAGRSELSYPVGSPGGSIPAHSGPASGAFFFFEGRRHVLMFTVELSPQWNVNAPDWRLVNQWKQNEWADQQGLSPALALEQRGGEWIITQKGGPIIWRMPAVAPSVTRFAADITFSSDPSKGRLRMYADKDGDGVYEYASSTFSGATLAGYESTWHTGCYEKNAGDFLIQNGYSING